MSSFDLALSKAEEKMKAWRLWRSVWNGVNYVAGGLSAALSAILAANAHSKFLEPIGGVACGATAAVLAYVLTVTKAGAAADGFEAAAREIELAIAEAVPEAPDAADRLRAAQVRGIKLLEPKRH